MPSSPNPGQANTTATQTTPPQPHTPTAAELMQTDPENTDKPANIAEDFDSEFDNETLGDRQPEACSMDDGCQTCQ